MIKNKRRKNKYLKKRRIIVEFVVRDGGIYAVNKKTKLEWKISIGAEPKFYPFNPIAFNLEKEFDK